MQAPTETQKPNRQRKDKYLNSIFNTKSLKNLVQTSSYIKTSVNNQKKVTLVGMNYLLLIFKCFVLLVKTSLI